jgi:aminopeptidase N
MRTENAPAAPHKTTYLKDYEPFPYLVDGIEMTFKIFEGRTIVTSTVNYAVKPYKGAAPDLALHGHNQKVHGVLLNGALLSPDKYRMSREGFVMPCPGEAAFTLTFETEIVPEANTTLEGLYKSADLYCTQCESEGFRRITYYPDRPDVMTTFKVRIEADKAALPVLLANGNLVESGEMEDGRHFAVWHDPFKKPAYLFALVAGPLAHIEDHFKTMTGRDVTLRIYTRAADIDQAGWGMTSLIQSMKWDEEAYGREYDLDIFNIVAVGDFNFGAMENKSLNIFNTSRILTRPDLSTDKEFLDIRRIVGHEYFHNWSGNRVTCRDWFQLSLKEGFTVFRENQFGQAMFDAEVERIEEVNLVRSMQFPEDASPMAHPVRPDNYIEISNFYTMTVYEKGGEVIRMLHTLLGPKVFREATDLYFSRHDGDAATCENFVKCMEDASGRDLSQFMRWYHQAGTPTIKASGAYDAAKKTYTLTLKQILPDTPGQPGADKKPQHIPVAVGLIGPNGADMANAVVELTEAEQSFTFENIGSVPVPSLFRGFSAPIILDMDVPEGDLRFRMVHDADGVNRWDAGQTLMMKAFARNLKGRESEDDLIAAIGTMIDLMKDKKKALLDKMLTLPDDSIVAAAHVPTDPAAIHAARDHLEHLIGSKLQDKLLTLYKDNAVSGVFTLTPDAVARRALRNTALELIVKGDEALGLSLAKDQIAKATTMTERLGALRAIASLTHPERDALMAAFYDQFKDHALVVDKWFSLQAAATRPSTVADIKALLAHPAFTWTNPNRVRSVLGAYALRNMPGFHDASGEGYVLLADAVIKLNGINPAVAARLLTPMRPWKSFVPALADKMKAQLERILQSGELSPDVYEVVSKTLNA